MNASRSRTGTECPISEFMCEGKVPSDQTEFTELIAIIFIILADIRVFYGVTTKELRSKILISPDDDEGIVRNYIRYT